MKHEVYTCGWKDAETQIPKLCSYPWGFISGKHPPGVPIQVHPIGWVLIFSKAIKILGGKASGDADEHVIEGEAKKLRVPTATQSSIFGKETGCYIVFKQLIFQVQLNS